MKRLVILAYYFPPDGGAGTQRAAKFCKYLADFGFAPTVVTRPPSRPRGEWEPEDRSLEREIGEATRVVHAAEGGPTPDWAPDLDCARRWLGPAFEACREVVREESPEAVLVTMSPFDLSIVGRRLARETGVPVVYDLRDPWALDGWRVRAGRAAWRRDLRAMREALLSAAGVVANTPAARDAFLERFPGLARERTEVIPNGYDAEDFAGPPPAPDADGRFRLVHTGTLHSKLLYLYRGPKGWLRRLRHHRPERIDPSGRTLDHLLRAVRSLRSGEHPLAERLEIVLVGGVDDATRRNVAEAGLAEQVRFEGYRPHAESVAWLRRADALFLPLHGLPEGERSLIVPGKTYEYLASGRPILGCLPEGDARDYVERSGRGYLARPCDAASIEAALRRLHEDARGGRIADGPVAEWTRKLERRRLTGRLAGFLETIACETSRT